MRTLNGIAVAIVCITASVAAQAIPFCSQVGIDKAANGALKQSQTAADAGDDRNAVEILQSAVDQIDSCDLPAARRASCRLDYESASLLADMPNGAPRAEHVLRRILNRVHASPQSAEKKVWAEALAMQGHFQMATQFDKAFATLLSVGRMFADDADIDVSTVAMGAISGLVVQLVGRRRCQEAQAVVHEFEEVRGWSVEPLGSMRAVSKNLAERCK